MFKKIIALGLISGSAILVVLIVKESETKIVGSPTALNLPSIKSETEIPKISRSESLGSNATQEIAKKVAAKLGPIKSQQDLKNLRPEKLVDQILADQLNNFDPKSLIPEVKIENLKITKTADSKFEDSYFQNLKAIAKSAPKLSISADNPDPNDFRRIGASYEKTITNLYNLLVPEKFADFHRELIKILTLQKNIFDNLANYPNDPLKALLSMSLLEESTKQLASLQGKYVR